MRLFRVNDSGGFTEYIEKEFAGEHVEKTLQDWLESNPHAIVEDGKLLVIGRQIATNLNTYIDLLALDKAGNVVVVELKRDRTPRDTLAQALEYAAFAAKLKYEQLEQIFQASGTDENRGLAEHHKAFFELGEDEAVSINKDQRIVIIGASITPNIQQTSEFLRNRGLRVTCVEFNFFQTDSGEQLLSTDLVVGREPLGPSRIATGRPPTVDRGKFLQSCDDAGRSVFQAILGLSESDALPVHWGVKGFSLNANVNGKHINLCTCFPPKSVFGQSLYTAFAEVVKKVDGSSETVKAYRGKISSTGLFVTAGNEMKYVIGQMPTNEQLEILVDFFSSLAKSIGALPTAESVGGNTE